AKAVFQQARERLSPLRTIWADAAYKGELIGWVKEQCGWILEIVEKRPGQTTFEVLPKRWVVERSFAWLNPYRLLDKEHELLVETSQADIFAAYS
ncbi:transposase, partial [Salmonella enterica]|uniref:transposase n=1 Tax=Salmonella enterica TaxID=28901 RepID=UPI003D2BCC96